jgi:hypothetical protein
MEGHRLLGPSYRPELGYSARGCLVCGFNLHRTPGVLIMDQLLCYHIWLTVVRNKL